jgi:hypothetical protein
MRKRRKGVIRAFGALVLLTACATAPGPRQAIMVEDVPSLNAINVRNASDRPVTLFYGHAKTFGALQMFMVRFRDRSGTILPVADRPDGWFTPKLYYSSFERLPSRSFHVPAGGSIGFERDLAHLAGWVRWNGGPTAGPCEVQLRLFAYLDRNRRRPAEAASEWKPGPCPE